MRETVSLCAVARNEGPYLLEWIAHHRLLGFDKIYIYDNNSIDETSNILQALAHQGVVEYIDWPDKPGLIPQHSSYADALKRADTEWIMFLDLDEFLVFRSRVTVGDFIAQMPASASSVSINWLTFASGGQKFYSPRPCFERFIWALPNDHISNHHVKSIVRVRAVEAVSVHVCKLKFGSYVGVDGKEITIHRNGMVFPPSEECRVHHYITKSREEFDKKIARGRGTRASDSNKKMREDPDKFFMQLDNNDHIDVSAVTLVHDIVAEVKRICKSAHIVSPFERSLHKCVTTAAKRVRGASKLLNGERVIRQTLFDALSKTQETVNFIQVGANDGRRNDPIYEFVKNRGWRGVLVEPNPAAFKALEETYAGVSGVVLLNVAVSEAHGRATLHFPVAGSNRIASLDEAHVLKHAAITGSAMTSVEVSTLPLSAVIADCGLSNIDLLVIDTEGHDLIVLSSIGLDEQRPSIIYIEYIHLNLEDRQKLTSLLGGAGYDIVVAGRDIIAIQRYCVQKYFARVVQSLVHSMDASRELLSAASKQLHT